MPDVVAELRRARMAIQKAADALGHHFRVHFGQAHKNFGPVVVNGAGVEGATPPANMLHDLGRDLGLVQVGQTFGPLPW